MCQRYINSPMEIADISDYGDASLKSSGGDPEF